jgi:hypothetical protein
VVPGVAPPEPVADCLVTVIFVVPMDRPQDACAVVANVPVD